jgi:hypothetical protein
MPEDVSTLPAAPSITRTSERRAESSMALIPARLR